MATTWAGTASNQLVTFDALLDGVNTGALSLKNTITGSSRIVTKSNVENYIQMGTYNSTWTGYSSTKCPTKSQILQAALMDFSAYAKKTTNDFSIQTQIIRGGTVISTSAVQTVNSTSCLEKLGYVATLRYNDVVKVICSYGGNPFQLYSNSGKNNCLSSGSIICGEVSFTITTGTYYSFVPYSYAICL
jgi:hypothetical protein